MRSCCGGGERSSGVWRCVHCTYDNNPLDTECAACSRAQKKADNHVMQLADHVAEAMTSRGPKCDSQKRQQKRPIRPLAYESNEGVSRCDSPASVSSSASSLSCSSTWLCSKCLLENTFDNKFCSSCHSERKLLTNFPHALLNNHDKQQKEDFISRKICQLKPLSDRVTKHVVALPPIIGDLSQWRCGLCNQSNSIVLAHCVRCNTRQCRVPSEERLKRSFPIMSPTDLAVREERKEIKGNVSEHPAQQYATPVACKSLKTKSVCKDEGSSGDTAYKEIIKYFRKMKTNFVDDSFFPCDKSIYGENYSPDNAEEIQWLRPSEIDDGDVGSNTKWSLFRTPLPIDIIQGSLGNCWLLSSLSVLADRPRVIEQIFLSKTVSPEGVYQLRLCKDGVWVNVIVDDYLPCLPNRKLKFAQCHRKQLWVSIIEKAVAKLYGSYVCLKAGHCSEGLQLLTGAPIDTVKIADYSDDLELFWGLLLSYKEAGFPIGVCCMNDEAIELGLTTRHAYSLLNLFSKGSLRLVQLRNPWAKDTWTGTYNNRCPSWTKDLRDELLVYEDSIEAVFWMELSDFMKYFTILDVCRLHDNWEEWRVSGVVPSDTSKLDKITYISVCETTCIDVAVTQPTIRGREGTAVDLSVAIVKCGEDNTPLTVTAYSTRTLLNSVSCSTIINPGTYMILPLSFLLLTSKTTTHLPYVLSCFVDKNSCVWQGPGFPDTIATVLYKIVSTQGQLHEALHGCSVYQLNRKVAGLVMAVENRNPNRWFHISCDNHNTSNVISTRGQISTSDWIGPLSSMVVMVLTQLDETAGFKIQSSYKFSLTEEQDDPVAHAPAITDNIHKVYPL